DGFFVSADWEDKVLQDAIHKFKYNFARELAEPLSKLMIKKITELNTELIHELKNFVILPVPLHQRRLAWRGFNQAELLAQAVAQEFGLQINNNLLIRKKYTSPQVKLKSKDRNKNIQGAFEIKSNLIFKNILLIDDVITTGATMNEIARILKNNGAKKVFGLAIARG
ncbi:ComF family protein, partial [Candidatus Parcubacteria bacterium]|nr:ComF family protein [Candidatus Parcubacteria bacterium]